VATFLIYALAGRIIFRLRQNLRRFAKDPHSSLPGSAVPHVASGRIAVTTVDTVETAIVRPVDVTPRQDTPPGAFPGRVDIVSQMSGYTCHIEAVPRGRPPLRPRGQANTAVEANTAAWAYCRCAMLFFLALLITWVRPSLLLSPPCRLTNPLASCRRASTVSPA